MSKTISLIQRVHIASPCTADWNSMIGDERSRFCSQCKLNVYNLSTMTEAEGERLILEKEGKLCARIYRRKDGTIITRDCPVGLRAVRKALVGASARIAAVLILAITVVAFALGATRQRLCSYQETLQLVNRWFSFVQPSRAIAGGVILGKPFAPHSSSGAPESSK